MRLEDYQPVTFNEFRGLFNRGPLDDCPKDHSPDCQNVILANGTVKSRDGFNLFPAPLPAGGGGLSNKCVRFYIWNRPNAVDIILWMDADRNLRNWTSATILVTFAGSTTDFSIYNFFDRIYITPHNGQTGISGEFVYLYDGVTFRKAAGIVSDATHQQFVAASGATSAKGLDPGYHYFAMIIESTSGFYSAFVPRTAGAPTVFAPVEYKAPGVSGTSAAQGTLTAAGVINDNDTVTIDVKVYTFKTVLTPTEGEILIGPDQTTALLHLIYALNHTGTPNVNYRVALPHPTVQGGFVVGSVAFVIARDSGTGGNTIVTTKTGANISWGAATLLGGLSTAPTKVNLTAIRIGPSWGAKRHIVATKALGSADPGSGKNLKYYFVPGADINDNTDNNASITLDFADTELIASADAAYSVLETIPSCLGIGKFANRLATWGEVYPNNSLMRFSEQALPETFDSITGFLVVNKEDGESIRAAGALRTVFYILKDTGTFLTSDNGEKPANWDAPSIDGGRGTQLRGLSSSSIFQDRGIVSDRLLVADRSGLYVFNGRYEAKPLSWKVEDTWRRINSSSFHKVTVVEDTKHKLIFVGLPLDSSVVLNYFLVGDYTYGLNPDAIMWMPYVFPFNPIAIGVGTVGATYDDAFMLATVLVNGANVIYTFTPGSGITNDDGSIIDAYYDLPSIDIKPGHVSFFNALRYRLTGSGTFKSTIKGEDGSGSTTLPNITLAATPGKEILIRFNFSNEKASVRMRVNVLNNNFELIRADLFGKAMWPMRPA